MKSRRSEDRVVYSTQKDTPPPERESPSERDAPLPGGLQARVQREKAHRAGRWVTVVYDLDLPDSKLAELCTRIKRLCATGGTVKDGRMEIQGDHAQKILSELASLGIRARRSGA